MFYLRKFGNVARLLVGMTFFISGFAKGVDIARTSFKIQEYTMVSAIEIPPEVCDVVAVFLIGFELLLGLFLLLGLYKRIVVKFAFVAELFFLCLTFIVAINGDITDCGCFGGFFSLSGWQSFVKNVILLMVIILAMFERTDAPDYKHRFWEDIVIIFVWVILFTIVNMFSQPLFDFSYYRVGKNLRSFSMDGNIFMPFEIEQRRTENMEVTYVNVTDSLLSQKGYVVLGIVREFNQVDEFTIKQFINSITKMSSDSGCRSMLLTSFLDDKINKNIFYNIDIGLVDNVILNNITLANWGIMIIHDGIIVGKWQQNKLNFHSFPETIYEIENRSSPIMSSFQISFWLLSFVLIVFFVIKNRGCRKARK